MTGAAVAIASDAPVARRGVVVRPARRGGRPFDAEVTGRYVALTPWKRPAIYRAASPVSQTIDQLIRTADAGDGAAAKVLFTRLYRELHALAERQLRRSNPELTLGTTTVLHEAYLRMAGQAAARFPDRGRFMAYAARAMRGVIIDYTRRRQTRKRGGEFQITLAGDRELVDAALADSDQLERLGEALETLAEVDSALAELVDLHFFGGFTLAEIAGLRAVSERTVQRDWRTARLLLHRALKDG